MKNFLPEVLHYLMIEGVIVFVSESYNKCLFNSRNDDWKSIMKSGNELDASLADVMC